MPESTPKIHLYSFGYKYSGVPALLRSANDDGAGGGFVFDCRSLPNPFWEENLRHLDGRAAEIRAYMTRFSEVSEFAIHTTALVQMALQAVQSRNAGHLHIAFGCTGGRHRSVYLVELLQENLRSDGWHPHLLHVELEKPSTGSPKKT